MKQETHSINAGLVESLTRRERDVLRLLAQHLRYQDIAEELTMALSSVKWYTQQIYGKLGVDNRRDAIERARGLGLLETGARPEPAPTAGPRHNLPRQLTRFIGREKEIDQVVELVRQNPLVTLTGAGGVGKTRLAQVVGGECLKFFSQGVWLVELAPLNDERLVAQTVAAALGLQMSHEASYLSLLSNYLRDRQILLVLDNCEHLLAACSQLTNDLLQSCSRLTILATSRERLGVAGEVSHRVPSMTSLDPDNMAPAELAQIESVRLFSERASAVQPGFQLSGRSLTKAAHLCHKLDGIPLAIELAAARVNVLSLEQIIARLDDRFRLLSDGSRTALPRHRTLRASIEWSYSLLSEAERALFQRLSVFSGGWSLEAAEEVCAFEGLEPLEILDGLSSLVNKSLVIADQMPGSELRYGMLETIRQYAQEKLEEAGQNAIVRNNHINYFLEMSCEYGPQLKTPKIVECLNRLDYDLDNFRAALYGALGKNSQEGGEVALTILSRLDYFWATRSLYWETFPRFHLALNQLQADDSWSKEQRAWGLYVLSTLKNDFYLEVETVGHLNECINLFREIENRHGLALALSLRCYSIFRHFSFHPPDPSIKMEVGIQDEEESLAIADSLADSLDIEAKRASAWVYCWIGGAEDNKNNKMISKDLGQKSRDAFLQLGDWIGELYGQFIWLIASIDLGGRRELFPDIDKAMESSKLLHYIRYQEFFINQKTVICRALDAFEEMQNNYLVDLNFNRVIGDRKGEAGSNRDLGLTYIFLKDYSKAVAHIQESIRIILDITGQRVGYDFLFTLLVSARLAVHTSNYVPATKMLGYIEREFEGLPRKMMDESKLDWNDFNRYIEKVRGGMNEADFSREWQQGRSMSIGQALDVSREILDHAEVKDNMASG